MNAEKIFRTTDYKLAAYLSALNIILEAHPNPKRPTKVEFSTSASDELYRAVAAFNADELIPVKTFCDSMDAIKDQMMDIIRGARR